MLVSHRKEFIFIKTEKTASTSVETYFEPFCLPDGQWEFSGPRDQYVGETGIIGARGASARQHDFYSHMPAQAIKAKVGSSVWDNYYKFTIVRNPFDMVVSYFHHLESIFHRHRFADLPTRRKLHRLLWSLQVPKRDDPVDRFRRWVHREHKLDTLFGSFYPGFVNNRPKYFIDGCICVDHFIHTENIHGGVREVCAALDVPYEPDRLSFLKSGDRPKDLSYANYYDHATRDIVSRHYDYEVDMFGYDVSL